MSNTNDLPRDEATGTLRNTFFTTANETYNAVTRTAIAARDAVRAAESALARAREAADQAEAAREAVVALMQRSEVQSASA